MTNSYRTRKKILIHLWLIQLKKIQFITVYEACTLWDSYGMSYTIVWVILWVWLIESSQWAVKKTTSKPNTCA